MLESSSGRGPSAAAHGRHHRGGDYRDLCTALVEHSHVLFAVGDEAGTSFLSPALGRQLGWSPEGLPSPELLARGLVHPDDVEGIAGRLGTLGDGGGEARMQIRLRHRDGGWRSVEVLARDLRQDPRINGYLLEGWDVTDREDALRQAALYDPLTRLPNRTLFDDRLRQALRSQSRRATRVAVLFLDLDGFKEVNDSYGHAAGDQTLREVARRLRRTLRPEDTAARWGGDEFAVLCEGLADASAAFQVATRVDAALTAPVTIGARRVPVGLSIGTVVADSGSSPDDLVARADRAMYEAKRQRARHRPPSGDA